MITTDILRTYITTDILEDDSIQIGDDDDLLLTGLLDSLGVVMLTTHLLDDYEIDVPPEDVTLENFRTLRSIETYLSAVKPVA